MAWYWPTIEDESSAEQATKSAVGASGFIAAVTALLSILSIIYHKPIVGIDGWGLVDAGIFVVVAWRIYRMSRIWAIIGLVLYISEVGYKLVTSPSGAIGVLTVIFVLAYIGAIRGTFAYHKYHQTSSTLQSPTAPG